MMLPNLAVIRDLLPHGPSWLLVDRIVELDVPSYIVTEMDTSKLDAIAEAHFPKGPKVVPGVLLIEFVGQSANLLGRLSTRTEKPHPPRAVTVLAKCNARFLAPAMIGERLTARVKLQDSVNGVSVHAGTIYSGQTEICRVEVYGVTSCLYDRNQQ